MSAGNWARIKQVVADAIERPAAARAEFIAHICGEDAEFRTEVLSLLEAHERARPTVLSEHGLSAEAVRVAIIGEDLVGGSSVGRYTLVRKLGAGGMGAVYEAIDPALSRAIAVKVLHTGLGGPGARRRFEREARALARLEHPAIARVHEAGVSPGPAGLEIPFFAMELVRGASTLSAFVAAQRPPLRRVLEILALVCDAVHHGHQKGVVHRDLKPGNILIDDSGAPKVIDFGVARLLDRDESGESRTVEWTGTPAYMPPEAADLGGRYFDIRGDVYSLGVVLYEVLAGRVPRDLAGLPPGGGRALLDSPVTSLGTLRRDCAGDIETIVGKAMANHADDRYASVAELAADIRRVLDHQPIAARPVSAWRHLRLYARRHRARVAAAGVAAAAVIVGVAGLSIGLAHARAQADRANRTAQFLKAMVRSGASLQLGVTEGESWPAAPEAGPPTMQGMLIGAGDQIERWFHDDPLLAADMASLVMQAMYTRIELPETGVAIERAMRLETAARGADSREALDATASMASFLGVNGNADGCHTLCRDSVFRAARSLGPADPITLRLVGGLGPDVENLRRARADLLGMLPADDERGRVMLDIAIASANPEALGEDQGEPLRRRAERVLAPGDPGLVNIIWMHAKQLGDEGRSRESIKAYRDALDLRPGDAVINYELWSGLYSQAMALGDFDEAVGAARAQIVIARRIFPPQSLNLARALARVARPLLEAGRSLDEAVEAVSHAVLATPDLLSKGDGWAVYHEVLYAWGVRLRGDPARALEILESRARLGAEQGVVPQPWLVMIRNAEMAQCLMDLSRTDEAGPVLDEADAAARVWNAPGWPSQRQIDAARARWRSLRPG